MKRLLCIIGIHERTVMDFADGSPYTFHFGGHHWRITHACWRCGKTWALWQCSDGKWVE